MDKSTAGRDLKIYKDAHTIPIHLLAKINYNWPKYKGVRVCCTSPFEGKMHFWQYDQ